MRLEPDCDCWSSKHVDGSSLDLPGPPIQLLVKEPQVLTFDTEVPGLKATAKGTVAGSFDLRLLGRTVE